MTLNSHHPRPHEQLILEALARHGYRASFHQSNDSPVGRCLLVHFEGGSNLRLEVVEESLKWLIDQDRLEKSGGVGCQTLSTLKTILFPDDQLDFGWIIVKKRGYHLPPQEVFIGHQVVETAGLLRYIGWVLEDTPEEEAQSQLTFCQSAILDSVERVLWVFAALGSVLSNTISLWSHWSGSTSVRMFCKGTKAYFEVRRETYHAHLQRWLLKRLLVRWGLLQQESDPPG